MKIDAAHFPTVEGSMTSDDGQTFMPHVKRPTGGDLLLGFPHSLPAVFPDQMAPVVMTRPSDGSGNC